MAYEAAAADNEDGPEVLGRVRGHCGGIVRRELVSRGFKRSMQWCCDDHIGTFSGGGGSLRSFQIRTSHDRATRSSRHPQHENSFDHPTGKTSNCKSLRDFISYSLQFAGWAQGLRRMPLEFKRGSCPGCCQRRLSANRKHLPQFSLLVYVYPHDDEFLDCIKVPCAVK